MASFLPWQVVHSDPGLWPSAHLRDEKPSHSLSCRWDYHFHCHHPHRNYHCCYHWHCHRHWMRNLHNFSVASRIIIFIVIVIIVELYSCFLSLKSVIFQVVLSWHPPVCPTWSNCASLKNLSWPTALVLPRSSSSTSGHFCRLLLTLVRMKFFNYSLAEGNFSTTLWQICQGTGLYKKFTWHSGSLFKYMCQHQAADIPAFSHWVQRQKSFCNKTLIPEIDHMIWSVSLKRYFFYLRTHDISIFAGKTWANVWLWSRVCP